MGGYTVAKREDALDHMDASGPGFGEMRWYSDALGTEQVSFSWRLMPPGTGGRGSYGHRHPGQEEVYLVLSGAGRPSRSATTCSSAWPEDGVRMTGRGALLGPQRLGRCADARPALLGPRADGAWGARKNYGRQHEGVSRGTVITDPEGKIARASPRSRPKTHDEILAALDELGDDW